MKLAPIIVAAAVAIPAVSFARSNQPLTRAEVKAQLVQIERAGYNPGMDNCMTYPLEIQAAEARVAAQNGQGYGGVEEGSPESGNYQGPAQTGNTDRTPAYDVQ
ncbi:DUF4148 domain-containing protein [Paraburkholderia rhynchosiae]|uniref:DUF4148 domain-containing protein n=1 Tax=Paraburkholderia rhynchosiae TaxID=487049 RepID=A0A2N7W7X9_9BURK|nr:DUF4148 domain-containing protein [Paraburkholderia rhynchosiae]PMS25494.1 hypothetical protein C0Z16_29275 [Paraburkholderia rhynchosiae]CAB3733882.1 hypothetical protein LMG27174_06064 [Paraburkholderia rhynchosiae]